MFWQNEAKFAKVFKDGERSHPPTLHGVVFDFFWSSWRIETLAEVLVCLPQRSEAMLIKDVRNKGISEHCLRPVSYTHLTLPTNREV